MKKLIGIYEKESVGKLIIQDNSKIIIEDKKSLPLYKNKELILNRNTYIVDPFSQPVKGEGVFNFRYGPVTSGVGEAGIYNLYTYGERILYLKVDTSYKHREIEKHMKGIHYNKALKIAEKICGNFSISHSIAFSRAVENALKINVSENTILNRAILLELERIYNHIYVISRLASAAAQQVLASHLEGLFEDCLVTNKMLSGSRYLYDVNEIGNVSKKIKFSSIYEIKKRLKEMKEEFKFLFENSMSSGNYIDRLHSTAALNLKDALEIGLTGPSLRACNISEDLRKNEKIYSDLKIIKDEEGDSLSRMEVRAWEILESINFILNKIDKMRETDQTNIKNSSGEGMGWCESPSGSVVYYINIENSIIKDIYISTPSVFSFAALAHSIIGNIFTDFPFAVESFGMNFADAAR